MHSFISSSMRNPLFVIFFLHYHFLLCQTKLTFCCCGLTMVTRHGHSKPLWPEQRRADSLYARPSRFPHANLQSVVYSVAQRVGRCKQSSNLLVRFFFHCVNKRSVQRRLHDSFTIIQSHPCVRVGRYNTIQLIESLWDSQPRRAADDLFPLFLNDFVVQFTHTHTHRFIEGASSCNGDFICSCFTQVYHYFYRWRDSCQRPHSSRRPTTDDGRGFLYRVCRLLGPTQTVC